MTVCPAELVQVTDGPPLALFADGLDTAIYRLDPGIRRFRCLSARDGLVTSMSASRSGAVVAALATTSYEPLNVHAGPPGGPLLPLTDTRPALRAIRWVTETITARSRAQVAASSTAWNWPSQAWSGSPSGAPDQAWSRLAPPRCGRGWPAGPASGG